MSKTTIGQKATRVLGFLLGLRNPRVAWVLGAHGFTKDELALGWQLLQALTRGRLDGTPGASEPDPTLLAELDAWENKWFPIIAASLRTRFPAAHGMVFNNLAQTEGVEVIISVGTLLERLASLGDVERGHEARALLEQRGLTEQVLAEGKRLLTALGSFDPTAESSPLVTEEEEAARETNLWNWYLEWSGIARAAIHDRRALRALGFLTERGGVLVEVDDGSGVDAGAATDPSAGTATGAATGASPVVAAPPRPGNGAPPAAPGMPGSDPFAPAP